MDRCKNCGKCPNCGHEIDPPVWVGPYSPYIGPYIYPIPYIPYIGDVPGASGIGGTWCQTDPNVSIQNFQNRC